LNTTRMIFSKLASSGAESIESGSGPIFFPLTVRLMYVLGKSDNSLMSLN
uniref:LINE-like reverse transcriptase n=1 Tax=Haemonchus placei TaxID=6290 RepID=A0A0N4WRV7_HAEPC